MKQEDFETFCPNLNFILNDAKTSKIERFLFDLIQNLARTLKEMNVEIEDLKEELYGSESSEECASQAPTGTGYEKLLSLIEKDFLKGFGISMKSSPSEKEEKANIIIRAERRRLAFFRHDQDTDGWNFYYLGDITEEPPRGPIPLSDEAHYTPTQVIQKLESLIQQIKKGIS